MILCAIEIFLLTYLLNRVSRVSVMISVRDSVK